MPVLDGIKAQLATHLQTLVKQMTLGTTGGSASSKDGGVGAAAMTIIQRIDDRTISISATFDTSLISAKDIKEVSVHGATILDSPAYRTSFHPISKNATNEVRVDIVMEIR